MGALLTAARSRPRFSSSIFVPMNCIPSLGLLAEGVHHDGTGPSYDDRRRFMNWTLEVVSVPVSDVDRAKAFYAEQLGFNVDHDTQVSEGNRIVQLTPPGSGCSIVIGEGTFV